MRLSGRKPSSFTRSWTQRQRFVLLALIWLNVAAFLGQLFLDAYQPGFVREFLGLSRDGIENAYSWQFFTAIFLHSGPWHLLGNTVALYLLGRDVECILGQGQFLFLYLGGAVAGELGHVFLMPPSTVLFAASGGTAAVLMAYATVLPDLELSTIRLFGRRWELKAKFLGGVVLALGLVLFVFNRTGIVTHSALLGGCAAGWIYAHALGFGRASFVQRTIHQRKANAERFQQMDAETFIAEEVDPLLEKISREGLQSLNRAERRTLAFAREKLEQIG
ncbi:MAG: rhomboid family intramembrane serine protease [Chthoniobacterales bacterium]